jgi:2'-5' RNA ligase
MKRLFFALWPDDASRHQVDLLNQSLPVDGRKLVSQNLHVTLVFLGNVDDELVVDIIEAASQIQADPVSLTFDALAHWKKPKILCLTCSKQTTPVYRLVNQLTRMLKSFPVRLETRPYRAHITMVRKAKVLPEIQLSPISMQFDRFVLVESVSTDKGVRYDVLASWPLQRSLRLV